MKCTSISSVLSSVFVVVVFASCGRRESADDRKGGAEQPADGATVLAEIAGRRITAAAFEAEMARRGAGLFQTEAQRRKLLHELITFEVLLARAKAAGFDRTPQMEDQIDRLIVARFQEAQFASQPPPPPPGESEVRAFYEENSGQYFTPAEVRAGLIFIACSPKATPEKRVEMRQAAAAVLAAARTADDPAFALLARQHSADQATRYRGGDTGWVRAGDDALSWPASVISAATALSRPGDCAPLVETPAGFFVVRLLGQKPGGVRAYEEVKDAIAYQMAQHRRELRQQKFLDEMKQGIQVEIHAEHLRHPPATGQAAEAAPPPVPKS